VVGGNAYAHIFPFSMLKAAKVDARNRFIAAATPSRSPKTEVPATKTSAPAAAPSAAVVASMPPSSSSSHQSRFFNHLTHALNFRQRRANERLMTEARIDRHDQHPSSSGRTSSNTEAGVAGLMASPTPLPRLLMRWRVRCKLLLPSQWTMNESDPASANSARKKIRIRNHQVRFQRQTRHPAQGFDDGSAHGNVRHKMSVHDIHMDAIRPGLFGLGDLLP